MRGGGGGIGEMTQRKRDHLPDLSKFVRARLGWGSILLNVCFSYGETKTSLRNLR